MIAAARGASDASTAAHRGCYHGRRRSPRPECCLGGAQNGSVRQRRRCRRCRPAAGTSPPGGAGMKYLESLNATFVIDTFLLLLIGVGPS
jgi:hypothetical protein